MPWIFVNILLVPHAMHIAYMYLLYAYTALLLILHTYMPRGCNKNASYPCTITWLLHRAKQISAMTRFYLCLYRFCLHAWLRYYSIMLYLVAYCMRCTLHSILVHYAVQKFSLLYCIYFHILHTLHICMLHFAITLLRVAFCNYSTALLCMPYS